ncbi:DNA repair protein RecN [Candidatus Foliamicus sp.]
MLTHLTIRNLAVVDAASLDMEPGFTALTGETGAGKSILIDALALATGERTDARQVRTGTREADISACFEIPAGTPLPDWADEFDLFEECIMRRVIRADGRSRGSLNGVPVPAQRLRALRACLVDICGQKAHQALLHTGAQLEILDEYGGLSETVKSFTEQFAAFSQAEKALDSLEQRAADRAGRMELLDSWIEELDALNPRAGELQELDRQRLKLANRARLMAAIGSALHALSESDRPAAGGLSAARRELESVAEFEPQLGEAVRMLGEAEVLVEEVASTVRDVGLDLDDGGGNLDAIEQRRLALLSVARKHATTEEELPELAAQLKAEKAQLRAVDEKLAEARARCASLGEDIQTRAASLSEERRHIAGEFAEAVSERMQGLALEGGRLSVEFSAAPALGRRGSDRLEFLVALNPGQAPRPLARCASGGELARIGLAIQLAAAGARQPPTMIFDEVDSGIGGRVAEVVGAGLAELGRRGQVLCVTHLPQVASQAGRQIRVSKVIRDGGAHTVSAQLEESERVREVARMLGGVEITPRALAHAEEMLAKGRLWQSRTEVPQGSAEATPE